MTTATHPPFARIDDLFDHIRTVQGHDLAESSANGPGCDDVLFCQACGGMLQRPAGIQDGRVGVDVDPRVMQPCRQVEYVSFDFAWRE